MTEPEPTAAAFVRPPIRTLLDAKLRAPATRPESVLRRRIIARLEAGAARPLTLVSAPAGYGKTTAVAQWLATSPRGTTVAWVTPDAGDDQPVLLWTLVATALQDAGRPVARDVASYIAANTDVLAEQVVPVIAAAMAAGGVTLVIDDFDRIRSAACLGQVDALIGALRPNAHLVLITRSDPSLRLARSRSAGLLSELRAADLAFTLEETTTLLRGEGLELPTEAALALLNRSEGWPTGIYLAALTAAGWPDPGEFVANFAGNHRFIADYLIEEVLSRQGDEIRNFILDVSVLDRFSAPLCDELTGTRRSAPILHTLIRTNLFLVPLDADSAWFRFHHLFRVVARSLLETEQPQRVELLHRRAAHWLEMNNHIGPAVDHALLGGRSDDAARLAQQHWFAYYDTGLVSEAERWVREIARAGADEHPSTVVAGAWVAAVTGRPSELDRRLDQLSRIEWTGRLPDGARSVASVIAMLQGQSGYRGPAPMLAYARRAAELETDGGTPWHALANSAYGHALYVTGRLHEAVEVLGTAAHNPQGSSVVRIQALALLALAHDELGRYDRARAAAEDSMALVQARSLQSMPAVSLAYTAIGRCRARAGAPAEAMATMERGLTLRRRIPGVSPWPLIHHLLATAAVAAELGDRPTARALLDEAVRAMSGYNEQMSAMVARVDAVRRLLDPPRPAPAVVDTLTARESELLGRLDSVLSLSEIAAELYISTNTAKTHAKSIYRKLGAGSRSDALRIARERRLI